MSFSVDRLKSPGIECLSAAAATAKSSASASPSKLVEPVDEAGGEGVARADAVDDRPEVERRAGEKSLPVPQHGRPAVFVRAHALAKGDGDPGQVGEFGHDPGRQVFEDLRVDPAEAIVDRGPDAERLLAILFVAGEQVGDA